MNVDKQSTYTIRLDDAEAEELDIDLTDVLQASQNSPGMNGSTSWARLRKVREELHSARIEGVT
jgi:NADPH-dependent ferric siderophore reductase